MKKKTKRKLKKRYQEMQKDKNKILALCLSNTVVPPKPTNYSFPRFEREELIDTSQTQIFK